jgi:glycosyltransferase involved in cell wall biosynthesis
MQPSLSVALASRNGAPFIAEQLRSIFAQSVLPEEIVVSDDASTDETVSIVEAVFAEFAATPVRTRIIRNETPLGVRENFEQAMRACSGDLISLCDQDDVWHPIRVERVTARFRGAPELLLLHSDARLVDATGGLLGYTLFEALGISAADITSIHEERAFSALMRRNLVTGATVVFRRGLLARALPVPAPWMHDEWLAVIAAAVGRVDVIEAPLIDYRQHSTNEIGVRKLNLRGKVGRILEPRGGRNSYLVERSRVLLARLNRLGTVVPDPVMTAAEAKFLHLRARDELPDSRTGRFLPVLKETLTGRYGNYSRGVGDIARDLAQPAHARDEPTGR